MYVAIVGSRDFPDLDRVYDYVAWLPDDDTVVTGGARGVDAMAEQAANDLLLHTVVLPAEWEVYGKRAGYKRNETIVDISDRVVAFWDGKSKGTKHTIDLALKMSKDLEVYFPE